MRIPIDQLRSGRWRVRVEGDDGKLVPVGETFDTKAEAIECRRAAQSIGREKGLPRNARTVGGHVAGWLKRRGADKNDTRRAEHHILTDPIAAMALRSVGRRDVKHWIERLKKKPALQRGPNKTYVDSGRTLSTKTIRECVTLLSGALADALDDGLVRENAAAGFRLARKATRRAFSFLYPDEDALLLGCRGVPLPYRIFYGVSAREGFRKGEELAKLGITWSDLDLHRGTVRLDENKTDDPRAWALDAGTIAVLAWWKAHRTDTAPTDRVFVGAQGEPLNTVRCARFREHLKKAGVTRPELYERSPARMPIRVHDLRATFVTLSLAAGKTEAWVQDRTGHTTNAMLQRYRRAARTVAEIGLGPLLPFDSLLPEMAASAAAVRENDPQTDPRPKIPAELLEIAAAFFERETGLEPLSLLENLPGFSRHREPADRLADRAVALWQAIREGDGPAVERAVLGVAATAEAVIGEPAELIKRIRQRDPRRLHLALELVNRLVPDAPARKAGAA